MSLQVWLPLNGDLKSQGLSNITVTNNGATVDNSGKIGKCYSVGSSKRITSTIDTSKLKTNSISFACWVYITSWNSSYDCIMSIADGTGWNQSRATLCRNNTASTLTWNIANNSTSARVSTTTSISLNTWTHIAATYDGATLKIYLNGTLNNSTATTLSIAYVSAFNIGSWTNANNYPLTGKINDIRIYDHALSAEEVKKLAQGLILHYPLNNNGMGGENLFTWANNATGITLNNYNNTGSFTQFTNSLVFDPSTTVGQQYTISFWARSPNGSTSLMVYNSNTNPQYFNFGSNPNLTSNLGPDWTYFTRTITNSQYSGTGTASTNTLLWKRIEIYAPNAMGVQVKQIKVEKGSSATSWSPASSDLGLDTSIVYDISGFKNHGTVVGSLTAAADTPRYKSSTVFDGNTAGIKRSMDLSSVLNSDYTISFWIKNGETGARGTIFSNYNSSPFFCIEKNSSNLLRYYLSTGTDLSVANTALPSNIWTFVTIVRTTNTKTEFYINGILKNTWTASMPTATLSGTWRIGRDSRSGDGTPFNGQLSDFRIYATALSATEVAELYALGSA